MGRKVRVQRNGTGFAIKVGRSICPCVHKRFILLRCPSTRLFQPTPEQKILSIQSTTGHLKKSFSGLLATCEKITLSVYRAHPSSCSDSLEYSTFIYISIWRLQSQLMKPRTSAPEKVKKGILNHITSFMPDIWLRLCPTTTLVLVPASQRVRVRISPGCENSHPLCAWVPYAIIILFVED